jgi:uncharacterized protein YlxW (UPF0749 family)
MGGELVVAGHVFEQSDEIAELREENRTLRSQLRVAEAAAAKARSEAEAAQSLAALRKQLNPLYRALQGVFGELDAIGVDDAAPQSNSRTAAVWEAWKSKIGGQPAQLIDAFLLHGEMTSGQIAIAIGISPKNVAQVVHKLNKAGLIQKNGGKFSLKQL